MITEGRCEVECINVDWWGRLGGGTKEMGAMRSGASTWTGGGTKGAVAQSEGVCGGDGCCEVRCVHADGWGYKRCSETIERDSFTRARVTPFQPLKSLHV